MMRNLRCIAITNVCIASRLVPRSLRAESPRRRRSGQLGQIGKGLSIAKKANDVRELQMTDAEEQELGQQVSDKIRTRYGVVQDAGVHRYVSLVGLALAQGSTPPDSAVDVHRPRHRRRQRLCGAWRLRARHEGRCSR